jgi:hypothetical protein
MLIERVIVALYGGPGMRKTTIAFTAEDPICLDFDGGSYRATNRKDVVPIERWKDAALMQASDFAGYKTAIVDTTGRALDKLAAQLIADDAKNATPAGALSLQGYGALKSTFGAWLDRLKSFGLDIVLVQHAAEERKGDDVIERLDVQGGSRGEIHKSADAMGRIFNLNGETWLDFNPTNAAFGKNPGKFPALHFTSPETDPRFLGNVITEIKRVLNSQSETVRAMREKIAAAKAEFETLGTPEAFTAKAVELTTANAEHAIKAALIQVAGGKGFEYSRTDKAFKAKPSPEEQARATSPATSDDPAFFGRHSEQTQAPALGHQAPEPARRKQGGGGRGRRAAG